MSQGPAIHNLFHLAAGMSRMDNHLVHKLETQVM